jgi:hypothetical protein
VSYEVEVTPEAEEDLRELVERDQEAAAAAVGLALDLRGDPYLGKELRDRGGLGRLHDCRSILFDRPDWKGKPRFRLVYRNEPHDGAPHVAAVLAIGDREKLRAYRDAAVRRLKRDRAQRRR